MNINSKFSITVTISKFTALEFALTYCFITFDQQNRNVDRTFQIYTRSRLMSKYIKYL